MLLESIILIAGISSMVSYETTGKGIADHAISTISDKDCKIARKLNGQDLCDAKATVTVQGYSNNSIAEYERAIAQRARAAR
jgi:hypothetical protein